MSSATCRRGCAVTCAWARRWSWAAWARPIVATRHTGLLQSWTVYVGGDTPLGPVYLGAAASFSGVVNAYLFIGAP
jgi:hypothetical protein